ncbi:MAG: haloacid dehalogenase-like hydrolase [Anaerolineae bacterium]
MDPLPSWNETPTKHAILQFIADVTDPAGAAYVPPPARIATFDNDGTLWCEKPYLIEIAFALQRLIARAQADPALRERQPYKALLAGDLSGFAHHLPHHISDALRLGAAMPEMLKLVYQTHVGMSQAVFEREAAAFFAEARHPRFGVPYKEVVYQPMLELVRLLQAQGFKVYVSSAGGMGFMRVVSEELYNIPRENVIGSDVRLKYHMGPHGPELMRVAWVDEPIDDGAGKPVNIELHIGRWPILAFGNANGDIEMLQLAQGSGPRHLCLLLRHDDPQREYAYDTHAEKAHAMAQAAGWRVVSMKDDFRTVFAFQQTNNANLIAPVSGGVTTPPP